MLLPKAGNIAEVIEELEKRVTLSSEGTGKIRMFSLYESKIQSEFDRDDPKSDHDDQNELFAEEIPKEEADKAENDKLLSCFHFSGDCAKQYGIPFKIVVKEGELFSETKVRIQARLGMDNEEFEKVKFVIYDNSDRITAVKLGKD
jgi:ubiquitin carboxyl-terminal hydrolase 7